MSGRQVGNAPPTEKKACYRVEQGNKHHIEVSPKGVRGINPYEVRDKAYDNQKDIHVKEKSSGTPKARQKKGHDKPDCNLLI